MRRKGAEMCWMCDHPEATAEEYLDEVYGIMLMHGWAVQHVECERRPFAYTVGLTRRGLPELVVTGLSPRRGQRLLNIAARRALVGDLLTPGMQTTLPAGPLVETVQVTHPDAHLYCAIAIFGDKGRPCSWCGPTGVVAGRGRRTSTKVAVPSRCSGCEPPGGQPDASALNVLPDNDLVTAMP